MVCRKLRREAFAGRKAVGRGLDAAVDRKYLACRLRPGDPSVARLMSHLWLPFTQMRDYASRAHTFVRGAGAWLWDSQGHRVYDATSSVWTTIHGHCHPRIVQAIAAQAALLDHATLLGAANPVAEKLAEKLGALASMDRAFFASDGASAIEAAIKM